MSLKDRRVVTMMSPSELAAIDDWMFQNRLTSRAEAIRRLCAMSLQNSAYNQMVALSQAEAANA